MFKWLNFTKPYIISKEIAEHMMPALNIWYWFSFHGNCSWKLFVLTTASGQNYFRSASTEDSRFPDKTVLFKLQSSTLLWIVIFNHKTSFHIYICNHKNTLVLRVGKKLNGNLPQLTLLCLFNSLAENKAQRLILFLYYLYFLSLTKIHLD